MTPRAETTIGDIAMRLATLDVRSWRGLPADLHWDGSGGEAAGAAMLGDALVPAGLVSLDTPPSAAGARAWLRDDRVVLVDVALDVSAAAPPLPDAIGAPERRLDVTYGLVHLPSGEWVYAARGLAVVVDHDRVRHVMGFVPCDADEYEGRLRVSLATTRRPLDAGAAKEGL